MGIGVVSVDDAEFGFAEKFEFGGTIIGEGFVVVEVLMSEVGENGDFDGDAEGAELGEGMGGGFKNEEFGAGIGDGANTLIKNFDAFGSHVLVLLVKFGEVSGVRSTVSITADTTPSNGGEQAGFVAGLVKHFPNHERSGGFAVGAGDGDDTEALGGEMVFFGGSEGLEPVPGEDEIIIER